MNFTLVDDWHKILAHAWSVRLNLLLCVTSAIEAGITYVADEKLGMGALVAACSFAASISRLIKQEKVSGKAAGDDDE